MKQKRKRRRFGTEANRMDLHEYKIMVVDDEPALRKMVGEFLVGAGFMYVVYAGSCREAKEVCGREHPHLILLDVMLPDGDGFTLLQDLHRQSDVPVLFCLRGTRMRTGFAAWGWERMIISQSLFCRKN